MIIKLMKKPCDNIRVTSMFGPRWGKYHNGIDLGVAHGKNIYSTNNGKIVKVGWDKNGYGNYLIVQHPEGFCTLYAHMSKIKVKLNQNVLAGEVIGLVGSTGNSTGPHIHFEIRTTRYGSAGWWSKTGYVRKNAVDPYHYLMDIGKTNYMLNKQDANDIIKLLSGIYAFIEDKTQESPGEAKLRRLANELRKASGQEVSN